MGTAQPLLLGLILLWSAYAKFRSPDQADRTALPRLLGETRAKPAYLSVAGVETLIGLALLLPPVWALEAFAAVALSVGFVGFLIYSKVVVPQASCGCAGKSAKPVGTRAIARALLLLATSVAATFAATGWWSAGAGLLVLVVEAAAFAMLSAELDRYWLLPLRRFRIRLSHPYAGTASGTTPLAATQRRVLLSPAYRAVDGLLRSDIHDYWDDDDWRFVSYAANYDGRRATAVFAVPHQDSAPESVRVAVVGDDGLTLYRPTVLATA
ncbi:MauE/DoxX family redox-associated membrane protein [Kribbella sp.]|uniref:MauE/DoxX family redox-associated membrane protein n=1 Tax=Kribbella sp. TaxID=1871183 RepID=UPI002D35C2DE|nr:MauE/DoxX family redox-associated membrane protein [Kribbella sp.]HZX02859.1 MauE/DoxX family redox-associated membrane protein [Kribbella sp.]